jgi:hypothetical protein
MSQEDIDRFVARLFDKDPPTMRPNTLPLPYSNDNHPPLVRIIVLLLTFFLAINTSPFARPSRKALMISISWIYGIAFLALQKCFTKSQRLSLCFYLMVFRVFDVDGCSYVP